MILGLPSWDSGSSEMGRVHLQMAIIVAGQWQDIAGHGEVESPWIVAHSLTWIDEDVCERQDSQEHARVAEDEAGGQRDRATPTA
jgi:hypothetical protein